MFVWKKTVNCLNAKFLKIHLEMEWVDLCSLKSLVVGHGGSSAGHPYKPLQEDGGGYRQSPSWVHNFICSLIWWSANIE